MRLPSITTPARKRTGSTTAPLAIKWDEPQRIQLNKSGGEETPSKANLGLQYVNPADLAGFRDRSAAKASAKTAHNKLKIVRTMLQTAWRDGFIVENPAAKVSPLKTEESIRRPFTLAELKKLLAVATDEWRGLVLVGNSTRCPQFTATGRARVGLT